uniref:hypothetical protein n=1 Tax=Saccharopolyspora galaxeae TaxID=2781241 RepID=UPI001F458A84|nr:hypothetical protein [Saccharopolyspora sp. HNM0986]
MRVEQVVTWIAAGLAIIAVGVAGWQLWLARREARQAMQRSESIRRMAAASESNAEKAAEAARNSHTQAERAWEQVKHARSQLEEARQERRASTQAEQWEWAYAVTMSARELLDTSNELVRVALDSGVAPHYRLAADRHYHQSAQRWQETMVKAVARTGPDLELQQQVITFSTVHQRLHGHLGVLLRAIETGSLAEGDKLTDQVNGLRKELGNAHRHLQRTVSASLATPDTPTQQITAARSQQPSTEQSSTGRPPTGQSPTSQPSASQPSTSQPSASQPSASQPSTSRTTG